MSLVSVEIRARLTIYNFFHGPFVGKSMPQTTRGFELTASIHDLHIGRIVILMQENWPFTHTKIIRIHLKSVRKGSGNNSRRISNELIIKFIYNKERQT